MLLFNFETFSNLFASHIFASAFYLGEKTFYTGRQKNHEKRGDHSSKRKLKNAEKNWIYQIVVEKQKRKMTVYRNNGSKTYDVVVGQNPGKKTQKDDKKTPEGSYYIRFKNAQSAYHKALVISYPNAADLKNARQKGINPGGDICIHGLGAKPEVLKRQHDEEKGSLGCIVVTNEEIDEIFPDIQVGIKGTQVQINP